MPLFKPPTALVFHVKLEFQFFLHLKKENKVFGKNTVTR